MPKWHIDYQFCHLVSEWTDSMEQKTRYIVMRCNLLFVLAQIAPKTKLKINHIYYSFPILARFLLKIEIENYSL